MTIKGAYFYKLMVKLPVMTHLVTSAWPAMATFEYRCIKDQNDKIVSEYWIMCLNDTSAN